MKTKDNFSNNLFVGADFLEHEQWKQFRDTDYWVSNQGRIQNRKFKDRYLSGTLTNSNGRHSLVVQIRIEKKSHYFSVGRIVWEAFKGKIPEGYYIIHKNRLPRDNSLQNLEMVKDEELYVRMSRNQKTMKWFKDKKTGKIVRGEHELARLLGCSQSLISKIVLGKRQMYPYNFEILDRTDDGPEVIIKKNKKGEMIQKNNENADIRELLKEYKIKQCELCEAIGVTICTLNRWLRTPLTFERERLILEGIKKMKGEI